MSRSPAAFVLDTHAWVWWATDRSKLSARANQAIEGAGSLGVASISCWEVAMLFEKKRMRLDRPPDAWVRQALGMPGIVALPLTPSAAVAAAQLDQEEFVNDPADRLIYATAREAGAPLITRDERMRRFDPRGTIW